MEASVVLEGSLYVAELQLPVALRGHERQRQELPDDRIRAEQTAVEFGNRLQQSSGSARGLQ